MTFSLLRICMLALVFALSGAAAAGELVVSAAASLSNAFKEIGQEYAKIHPTIAVHFNFGASDALFRQIANGAPVDLFATADEQSMDMAQREGLILASERHDFVRNALVMIAPADSKLTLDGLESLRAPEVKRIALGNPTSVPAGRYAKRALDSAQLWNALEPKFVLAQTVRQALDYVARGEVEAGFVYATDAAIAKNQVRVLREVPLDLPLTYPIAPVAKTQHLAEARDFMAYVRSLAGQAILARYGFRAP